MKRLFFALLCVFGALSLHAQLPKVTLKDIHGKIVQTDTLSNGGKPFIIDFFATWCKPCNRELDAIHEVYEEWQAETGVKIYAVSIDQAQNINQKYGNIPADTDVRLKCVACRPAGKKEPCARDQTADNKNFRRNPAVQNNPEKQKENQHAIISVSQ